MGSEVRYWLQSNQGLFDNPLELEYLENVDQKFKDKSVMSKIIDGEKKRCSAHACEVHDW